MVELTSKQAVVLSEITSFYDTHGYAASVRELAGNLSKSPSTIHRFLVTLKNKGFIEWEPERPRTLRAIKVRDGEQDAD